MPLQDIQAYCGCNDVEEPEPVCDFCPYGGVLKDPSQRLSSDNTTTCGDWEKLTKYAKDDMASCALFQYVGLQCCEDMDIPDFVGSTVPPYAETDQDFVDSSAETVTQSVQEESTQPENIKEAVEDVAVVGTSLTETSSNEGTSETVYSTETGGSIQTPTTYHSSSTAAEHEDIGYPPVQDFNNLLPPPPTVSSTQTLDNNEQSTNDLIQNCFQKYTMPSNSHVTDILSTMPPMEVDSTIKKVKFDLDTLFKEAARKTGINLDTSILEDFDQLIPGDIVTWVDNAAQTINQTDPIVGQEFIDQSHLVLAGLLQDMDNVALPGDMEELIPPQFMDSVFMPGLSGCLEDVIEPKFSCNMCPDGSSPGNPDKMIPVAGVRCDEYDAWTVDASKSECDDLKAWMPFNMASWCGCPSVSDPPALEPAMERTCTFCPEGMILVLQSWRVTVKDKSLISGYVEDSTCAEWSQLAPYATTPESCDFLQMIGYSGCCEWITGSILEGSLPEIGAASSDSGSTVGHSVEGSKPARPSGQQSTQPPVPHYVDPLTNSDNVKRSVAVSNLSTWRLMGSLLAGLVTTTLAVSVY